MQDVWVGYLRRKAAEYRSNIELLQAGRLGTTELREGAQVDTTAETLAHVKANLAEIESILTGAKTQHRAAE